MIYRKLSSIFREVAGNIGIWSVSSTEEKQYSTVEEAIANLSSGQSLTIGKGTHVLSSTVTIPDNVAIIGATGVPEDVILQCASGVNGIVLGDGSCLHHLKIVSAADSFPALVYEGTTSTELHHMIITGSHATSLGISFTSGTGTIYINDVTFDGTFNVDFTFSSTGKVITRNQKHDATSTTAFEVTGTGTLRGDSITTPGNSSTYTYGLYIDEAVTADIHGLHLTDGVATPLYFGENSDGMEVSIADADLLGTSTDLEIASGATGVGSTLHISSSTLREENVVLNYTFFSNAVYTISTVNRGVQEDSGTAFFNQISVGLPEAGAESVFGEGDSTTIDMKVFTYDGAEYTDVTAEAQSKTGSTFALFDGVTAGVIAYIGNTSREFSGIKCDQTTAMVLGAGSIIWEYWDGDSWESFDTLSTDADSPYDQYANNDFIRASTSDQIRFSSVSDWATTTINTVSAYWVRCRIVSDITTSPVVERFKLHTNRTEVNSDGFVEFFGAAQPVRNLLWHYNLADPLDASSPGNKDITLSTNITLNTTSNKYINNATDGIGGLINLPKGLDTSRPLSLEVLWIAETNGSPSNVELEMNVAEVVIGDTLDGTITDVNVTDVSVVGASDAEVLKKTTLEYTPKTLVPGDLVAISFFRDASGGNADDDFAGNINIVKASLFGTFWN